MLIPCCSQGLAQKRARAAAEIAVLEGCIINLAAALNQCVLSDDAVLREAVLRMSSAQEQRSKVLAELNEKRTLLGQVRILPVGEAVKHKVQIILSLHPRQQNNIYHDASQMESQYTEAAAEDKAQDKNFKKVTIALQLTTTRHRHCIRCSGRMRCMC